MNSRRDYYVTFDLWETLFIDRHELDTDRNNSRINGLHRVLSRFGMRLSRNSLRDSYNESANQFMQIWERAECISVSDQIRMIIRAASQNELDLPQDPSELEELQKAYVNPLFEFPPSLNKEAISTLQGMRNRVRKIGLISNTGRSPGRALRELMSGFDILRFFDATIFSDEIGYRKPDRRIFEAAMAQLGAVPARTIHIGDDPNADIHGAKQAGMRAILFDYPVPNEFKQSPSSLFSLTRANRAQSGSTTEPDAKVASLGQTLAFIDSLT